MKRSIVLRVVAAACCVVTFIGTANAQTAGKQIAIVNMSTLNAEQVRDLVTFLRDTLNVRLHGEAIDPPKDKDLLAVARVLSSRLDSTNACVVGLVNGPADTKELMVLAPEPGWAVINVTPLAGDKSDPNALKLRTMKQTMRGVAYLFGLGDSLDPLAVNHPWKSVDDLDKAGSTFSPPDIPKFESEATRRGIELLERPKIRRKAGQPKIQAGSDPRKAPPPAQK